MKGGFNPKLEQPLFSPSVQFARWPERESGLEGVKVTQG